MGRDGALLGCLPCRCCSATQEPDDDAPSAHSQRPDRSAHRVQEVPSSRLVPMPRQRAYPHHAVGIDDQVNRVIQLLEWENETKVAVAVVLHGLGGMGKTTLADAVVARLDIQGWSCSTVLEPRAGFVPVRNFEDHQQEIQDMFGKEQAFIYIDNVTVRVEHLHKLLPNNSCNKKLRLLLTARDEMVADALKECGIHSHVYPVKPLSLDAMELLCKNIRVPGTIPTPQINEMLKICDGVPLVLERVGAYICQSEDKDEAYRRIIEWGKDGRPFSFAEEYSIEKKGLLFDLDELPVSTKETFLDICSFFNGWDWDKVSCILAEDDLNRLRKRAMLLKKEECENKVTVPHIILRIGLNMTKGKRFTNAHDLSKALEGDEQGIRGINGIWLQDNRSEPFILSARKLDLMHNSLRVLALGDMTIVVDGQCHEQEFKQLIYFQAGLIPYIPFHPTTPQELRFLDCRLPHNINNLQLTKISSKLNVFNLNGGRCDCQFGTQNIFGRLRGLRTFKMTQFKTLNIFREDIRSLTQLEELDLSGCKNLVQLPEGLGYLEALRKLSLRSCESLQKLPGSFGKLRSLKYLDLHSCKILEQLPEDFGSLSSLEELDLGYCSRLTELPTSFGKLSSLKVLTLVCCELNLNHLHDDIRYLSALVRIEFQGSRLVSIPCRYIKLVKNLSSKWCEQLTNLPKRLIEVTSVRSLDLHGWSSLERLPEGFGQLKSLVDLNIKDCSSLQELSSDFHCLASLQTLNLESCKKLEGKWMDSVGKIKTLELVSVQGSPMLEKRWAEMAKGGESWHFAVRGSEDWNSENVDNMLYKSSSKLFTADCLLTDSHGKPFSLSTVAPDTVLLVIYHYPCRPNISVNYLYMWKLLEEVVKHEHPLPFQMIFVGKCFEELSKGLAEIITAYASVDSDAHLFFKKVFNIKVANVNGRKSLSVEEKKKVPWIHPRFPPNLWKPLSVEKKKKIATSTDSPKFVVTKVVADEEGRKHFSTWENIQDSFVDFLLSKSRLYSHLEKLTGTGQGTGQETNVNLLSALFDTGESTSSIFVRSYTENIGVHQLHGKTVLLFISMDEHHVMDGHLFQSLTEIYLKAKTDDDMEILSIPIPAEVQGQHPIQEGSDLAGFESTLRKVPWPVLRNPWSLKTEVYYFFKRKLSQMNPAILVVVEPNGRIRNKNALPLIERWGTEVYPFTEEKMEQLERQTPQLSEEESHEQQIPQLSEEESHEQQTPQLSEEESLEEFSEEGSLVEPSAEFPLVLSAQRPADFEGSSCFPVLLQMGLVSTTDSFPVILPPISPWPSGPSMPPNPSYSLPVSIFVSYRAEQGRMRVEAPVDLRGASGCPIMLPFWMGCECPYFCYEDLLMQTATIFPVRRPRYF